MTYNEFSGSLTITPPLSWAEVRNTDYASGRYIGGLAVIFRLDVQDTDEGTLTTRTGTELQTIGVYAGDIDLESFVNAFPAHEFDGYIYVYENGITLIKRLSVSNGEVVCETASVTWTRAS